MAKSVLTILKSMRSVLTKRGWRQREFAGIVHGRHPCPGEPEFYKAPCYCILGAVYYAQGPKDYRNVFDVERHPVMPVLIEAAQIKDAYIETPTALYGYNDRKRTTKEDILDIVERAIQIETKKKEQTIAA